MTGIANHYQCPHNDPRFTSTYSSSSWSTVNKKTDAGDNLSVSLRTAYTYSETRYTPGNHEPVTTYSPPLRGDIEVDKNTGSANNASADLVLSFIEQRLLADIDEGATREELQSRLNAGFEGFMQGYNDAVSMLVSVGLFEGEVKDAVQQMFKQVVGGFADLAEKFELENPAEGVLQEAQQKPSRVEAEAAASREYSFNLRTTDGDIVKIRSWADQYSRYQSESNGSDTSQLFEVAGLEGFHFSVQGELDSEEVAAISDLLSQLNDVAELFFEGDIYSAFEQAQAIGYDSGEIARFSLNLNQSSYTYLENTYGAIAKFRPEHSDKGAANTFPQPASPLASKVPHLSEFLKLLDKILEKAERFAFEPASVGEFVKFAGQSRYAEHPHANKIAPFIRDMSHGLQSLKEK